MRTSSPAARWIPATGPPRSLARCPDRDDAAASAQLGLGEGGLGYWVAAVRETFEEAGVLLARTAATGELVDPAEPRLAQLRDDLNAGALTFQELIESEDLLLDVGGLYVFSHWITPEGAPRRYDTLVLPRRRAGWPCLPARRDRDGRVALGPAGRRAARRPTAASSS